MPKAARDRWLPCAAFTLCGHRRISRHPASVGAVGLQYFDDDGDLRASCTRSPIPSAKLRSGIRHGDRLTPPTRQRARRAARPLAAFATALALDFGGEREWQLFSTLFDRSPHGDHGVYASSTIRSRTVPPRRGCGATSIATFGGEWSLGADAA
jgi:hypothetical protein